MNSSKVTYLWTLVKHPNEKDALKHQTHIIARFPAPKEKSKRKP